jgi:hypothetical protein
VVFASHEVETSQTLQDFSFLKLSSLLAPYSTPGEGKISADVIWGKKHEKAKRKTGRM